MRITRKLIEERIEQCETNFAYYADTPFDNGNGYAQLALYKRHRNHPTIDVDMNAVDAYYEIRALKRLLEN